MTAANFEECGLNNTAGQTEQDSELGLQFPSRGEQFAAAGGGDPWEQEPQCRCVCGGGVVVEQRKEGQDHPGPRPPPGGCTLSPGSRLGTRRQDLGEVVIPTVKQD